MKALLARIAYWRDRYRERKERKAWKRGDVVVNFHQRLKQLERRAHR